MTCPPDAVGWLHPAVSVGPSRIAGMGLFAHETIPAGTELSRVGGRLVSTAELHALIAEADRGARDYVDSIVVDEDMHLVLPPRSANRFGNHSCDPNLWWVDSYTLCARRLIPAGEELTNDYATSTVERGFLLRCNCGSPRCRGMIEGDDWQIPELQLRYAGHWVPTLQRRIEAIRHSRAGGGHDNVAAVRVEIIDEARTRELRRAVLRPHLPPGAPMPGDELSSGVHLAAVEDDGTVLGTCFVYPDPCPWLPERVGAWHLRQMATADGHRGRGIGGAVLEAAVEYTKEQGAPLLWCNARESAVAFYRAHGFRTHGDIFTDERHVIPHQRMWRELSA